MSVMSVSMKGRAGFMHFDRRHSWKDQKNNNKSPAGYHNPPPRAHHRNLPGCIFPRTLTYCFTVMVYLFSTVCYVYYRLQSTLRGVQITLHAHSGMVIFHTYPFYKPSALVMV